MRRGTAGPLEVFHPHKLRERLGKVVPGGKPIILQPNLLLRRLRGTAVLVHTALMPPKAVARVAVLLFMALAGALFQQRLTMESIPHDENTTEGDHAHHTHVPSSQPMATRK
jgi:hypothetical protein